MPRIDRLTDALRGRGKALAYLGAATALAGVGAGTAAAATTAPPARPVHQAPAAHGTALHAAGEHATTAAPTSLTGHGSTQPVHAAAPQASHTQAPATQPASSEEATEQTGGQIQGGSNYEFYDSVTPSQIPAGHPVATYADGPYAAQQSQVSGKQALWIDTNGSDPGRASVLDVEPGDATPAQAAQWVQQRETQHPGQIAVVYTMMSDWGAAQQAISALPHAMQANVRWWIADPTGTPHIVPGATATQWYWGPNYDISSANGTL